MKVDKFFTGSIIAYQYGYNYRLDDYAIRAVFELEGSYYYRQPTEFERLNIDHDELLQYFKVMKRLYPPVSHYTMYVLARHGEFAPLTKANTTSHFFRDAVWIYNETKKS